MNKTQILWAYSANLLCLLFSTQYPPKYASQSKMKTRVLFSYFYYLEYSIVLVHLHHDNLSEGKGYQGNGFAAKEICGVVIGYSTWHGI